MLIISLIFHFYITRLQSVDFWYNEIIHHTKCISICSFHSEKKCFIIFSRIECMKFSSILCCNKRYSYYMIDIMFNFVMIQMFANWHTKKWNSFYKKGWWYICSHISHVFLSSLICWKKRTILKGVNIIKGILKQEFGSIQFFLFM